jgi:protein gp37
MAKRLKGRCGYPADEPFRPTLHPERMGEPEQWRKPSMIFVGSMGDLFHEKFGDATLRLIFSIMATNDQHTYMVLTKRPARMRDFVRRLRWRFGLDLFNFGNDQRIYSPSSFSLNLFAVFEDDLKDDAGGILTERHGLPKNIWVGVSVEDQATADERIPVLLDTPAAVQFVSYEPALGPVDFSKYISKIKWLICGGESGPRARPMHPDWARTARDQAKAAGIPFYFKQWGEWTPDTPTAVDLYKTALFSYEENGDVPLYLKDLGDEHRMENWFEHQRGDTHMFCVGKKAAGRVLDGRVWEEKPCQT